MPESTELVVIEPEQMQQVEEAEQYGLAKIEDEAGLAAAAEERAVAKKLIKALDSTRADLKKPLLDKGKKIDATFKPIIDRIEKVVRRLGGSITAYYNEQERIRREQEAERRRQEELAAKQREGKDENGMPVIDDEENVEIIAPTQVADDAPKTHVQTDLGSMTVKEVWDFEIEDEAKIPREYMVPELKLIRSAVQAGKSIPGVRAFKKKQVASR